MGKSPDAFRTISEVSEWLDTPAHVLRFWESKFSQIKPVKRAGGRRYYRPDDMELLGGIKALLHEQGMTIKGVQRLLRQEGVKHVAAMGQSLGDETAISVTAQTAQDTPADPKPLELVAEPKDETVVQDAAPKPNRKPERVIDARQIDMFAESNVVPLSPKVSEPSAVETIPDDPEDEAYHPPARFFRAYRHAHRDDIKARAAEIRPYLDRLETVLNRLSQSI